MTKYILKKSQLQISLWFSQIKTTKQNPNLPIPHVLNQQVMVKNLCRDHIGICFRYC